MRVLAGTLRAGRISTHSVGVVHRVRQRLQLLRGRQLRDQLFHVCNHKIRPVAGNVVRASLGDYSLTFPHRRREQFLGKTEHFCCMRICEQRLFRRKDDDRNVNRKRVRMDRSKSGITGGFNAGLRELRRRLRI